MGTRVFQCGRFELTLERPRIMGVVNITPDSFHADSRRVDPDAAVAHARQLIAEGADLLDLGAESTRPGALPIGVEEQWRRLAPVLEALRGVDIPLSVDTRSPEVMKRTLDAGADMINDITGFADPEARAAVRDTRAGLCLMHMAGEPSTMQARPVYRDVVSEVTAFLYRQASMLHSEGVGTTRMLLDPGIGFGKTLAHNLALLRALSRMADQAPFPGGLPMLIGVSRKSMVGELTGRPVADRLAGSLAAALAAVARGASILRVHDVAATRDALAVWLAVGGSVSAGPAAAP